MKLASVYIKNFRNINELYLKFSDFNVLVGENSIGKTNILMAIFKILKMNESPYRTRFVEEDFYLDKDTNTRAENIIIQLNFVELNENDEVAFVSSGIDIENEKLSIKLTAEWDNDNNDAKVEIFFLRQDDIQNEKGEPFKLKHKKYIPFHYIDAYRDIWRETQHSNGELKQIFKDYNKNFLKPIETQLKSSIETLKEYIDKNKGTIDQNLVEILKKLETSNPDLNSIDLTQIPPELDNLKGNIINITQKLNIQEKLIELHSIVNGLESMDEIRSLLEDNLSLFVPENSHLNLEMGKIEETDLLDDSKIYLGDASILKQGSGFQNSFVIALKISHLLSSIKFSKEKITNLIIALEEPEAHMHPHLQRSFINKIKRKREEWLTNFDINVQFIITTHSPFVLSQVDKSEICLLKKENSEFQITRLDDQFIQSMCNELSESKLKHFDYIFRIYPEIFLSRGVIIVEGQSEYGAIPEMAKKIQNVDLDELGLTVIYVEGKKTLKQVYVILKKFTKCIAIRDKDKDGNNDDRLVNDPNEQYYTTNMADFEEEIVNSVNGLFVVKRILLNLNDSNSPYLDLIRRYIPESRTMELSEILEKWEELNLETLEQNLEKEKLSDTLGNKRNGYKNALFWSIFCSDIKEEEIPTCYKDLILEARDMVI